MEKEVIITVNIPDDQEKWAGTSPPVEPQPSSEPEPDGPRPE